MTAAPTDSGKGLSAAGQRWLSLVGVLLGEYALLSYLFDALQMQRLNDGFGLLGHLGTLAPLGVVVGTASLLLLDAKGRAAVVELTAQTAPEARAVRFVGLNLSCYALFLWLTDGIFDGPLAESSALWLWVSLWVGLGMAVVTSLMTAAMPWAAWRRLGAQLAPALAGGAAVGVLAWGAGLATAQLWQSLSMATLTTVGAMLSPFVYDMVYLPEDRIIGSERFFVVVGPECSGFEGLGLMGVFLGLYLVTARRNLRFPRALWLLPAGLVAVWLGNSLRIAALVLIGVHLSPDVALGGFHSKAGWLFFCGVALALVALSRRSALFGAQPAQAAAPAADDYHNPTAAYLTPLLALVATGLVTGLFAVSFDALYGLRVLAVLITIWVFRAELPKPSWAPSWEAPAVGVLVFLFWAPLVGTPEPGAGEALMLGLAELPAPLRAVWLGLRVMGGVVTVPIAEELAFRGFLLRRVISADFTAVSLRTRAPLAWLISSLAFGVLHPSWVAGTLAGLCYALVAARRGKLSDAIVAHAVTNALIAGQVLLRGHYWLW
jgi:exosortase E/protease (VPEID-CTERM system)